jgi:hypothetical protein
MGVSPTRRPLQPEASQTLGAMCVAYDVSCGSFAMCRASASARRLNPTTGTAGRRAALSGRAKSSREHP